MATRLRLRIFGSNAGDQYFHFAESMQYELHKLGTAHVENLDTMTDEFMVVVKKPRDLNRVEDRIRRVIEGNSQWVRVEVERA